MMAMMYQQRLKQLKVGERSLLVYLPPSYGDGDVSYPVAYVQDQGDLFKDCLNYLESLYSEHKLSEVIMVGVESQRRNDEYTPWRAKELLDKSAYFGGEGEAYIEELADRIKPFIDREYRTRKEPEHTAIIGGSLGGLVSLFALHWRPDVFGLGGLISASFWYEGVLDFVEEHPLPESVRLFMSVGKKEGNNRQTIQKEMYPFTMRAYLSFQAALRKEALEIVVEPEGTHDPVFMVKQYPLALSWLFDGVRKAEGDKEEAFRISGTTSFLHASARTGRQYRISVAKPMAPAPAGGYPVLYTLDANATFGTFAEAFRLQSRRPRGHEPAIIVGIGYESDDPMVTPERFIDYTEPAEEAKLPTRPDGSPWPANGGADDFLAFIEEELKPEIEGMYSINRSRQALFGHSLGGFFALYAMLKRSGMFQLYFAGSPSVWWNGHALYRHLDSWLAERRNDTDPIEPLDCTIWIGTEEKESMIADAGHLASLLRQHEKYVRVTYFEVEGEGHVSMLPSIVSPILRAVSCSK